MTRTYDIHQVSTKENNLLIAPYTGRRSKKILMEHNKVPAPDSFSAEFYQSLWDIIKTELLEIFGFFTCRTDIIVSSKF
jgi:hypothetical protein